MTQDSEGAAGMPLYALYLLAVMALRLIAMAPARTPRAVRAG
jgi:hypothetical protein